MVRETTILIAEDDAGHFLLVKKNLWQSCVAQDILHFKDGQEVLNFLFKRGDGPVREDGRSYLLLLDIRMPKVDGREVLRQIKQDEDLRDMPVIMLTTTDAPDEINRCYELGCSFYIIKPVDYRDFMDSVSNLGAFLSLSGVKIPSLAGSGEHEHIASEHKSPY
ncbi:Response regulator rcp1 [Anaerohalosphaera lusitana]|uniref:Response regulator rcp1 n=1 Tax=Anaerohalosphaera lusitana TaxID=1936003 RepID=A0A1U9NNR4_9BACT|nr:response regulator [Anaerohalosphaera lusitana]AQT69437.1 Response regulator rcp1 [Anaerohalosphaera lusitana]